MERGGVVEVSEWDGGGGVGEGEGERKGNRSLE